MGFDNDYYERYTYQSHDDMNYKGTEQFVLAQGDEFYKIHYGFVALQAKTFNDLDRFDMKVVTN